MEKKMWSNWSIYEAKPGIIDYKCMPNWEKINKCENRRNKSLLKAITKYTIAQGNLMKLLIGMPIKFLTKNLARNHCMYDIIFSKNTLND